MILQGQRCFLLGRLWYSSIRNASTGVDKATLSKLRKKTGYALIKVKKALEQFGGDIKQAEKYLRDQAQKEGWAKATKLQERPMSQGVIGVMAQKNMATLVEVNCETDFVARNASFRDLVAKITATCQRDSESHAGNKLLLTKGDLEELKYQDSRIADIIALEIGNVGENIAVRRAARLKAEEKGHLGYYVHSSSQYKGKEGNMYMGSYGALVSFNRIDETLAPNTELPRIGQQICQHIVGMNPKQLGSADATAKEKDSSTDLLHQEFVLDSDLTVKQFLDENGIEVKDFVRFQCGEELPTDEDS